MSLVLPLINVSVLLVPLFAGGVMLFKPCLPPFLGSTLAVCRNGQGIPPLEIRLGFVLFETFIFLTLTTAGSFPLTQLLLGVNLTMWNYLRILKQW
jgi:hypothetical protein